MFRIPINVLFGWTDGSKAMAWLQCNFGSGSAKEIKAGGEQRMLLFDDIFRVNREPLQVRPDYKVLPICHHLTQHISHDLSMYQFFSTLKAANSNILHRRSRAGERGVWKGNFYTLPPNRSSNGCFLVRKISTVVSGIQVLSLYTSKLSEEISIFLPPPPPTINPHLQAHPSTNLPDP